MSDGAPPATSNPAGTFIQAFARVTKNADSGPAHRHEDAAARWSPGPTLPQP